MRTSTGSCLLAASTVFLLTACDAEPVPIPPPPPTPGVSSGPECLTSGVALTAGQVEAASGLRAMRVTMVNCGKMPYAVNGHPALRVLDADRKPLTLTIAEGTSNISRIDGFDDAPQPGTLAPGGEATAVLVWRNTVTDSSVPATTGVHIEVAPAAGQPTQLLTPQAGVDLGTTGTIATSPWVVAS
ncbi:DUF4232 domain-containing protein [Micromonospora sp. KC606]|uniref:DUF4232 domain-containing protein n=1 Tax=Micromonospora sp. KC606 TaxID=2530379 RepID=UPI001044C093|nr:DUF4232 domain-containing protein [Micromonospora sp. KC606]TDC85660.1 DUF4232 domain-containing protein [Micromonospora sp. KC606]